MAGRTLGKLNALTVGRTIEPGMYGDGGGLWLQVTGAGAKSWIFRFTLRGRPREMGLGPLHTISLAEARLRVAECRRLCHDGVDPIEARRARRARAALEAAKGMTFKDCAERLIASHEAAWKNEKHRAQWRSTLATYVHPTCGELSVAAVDTGLVLKVLEPIWTTKPETAGRVRGRIEAVLDWAKARGYREGENPARWRGHLDKLLPKRPKLQRGHLAAMPFRDVPAFVAELRQRDGVVALALELTILTASRSGEVLGSRWNEIDREAAVWTIPAERMKSGREHRVPLTGRALEILDTVDRIRNGEFLFPGQRSRPLSPTAMDAMLRRMTTTNATVHGFRSSFRDWAGERTTFPREVAEAALAHLVGDETERAYRRGDALEKRRELMTAWAAYLSGDPQ